MQCHSPISIRAPGQEDSRVRVTVRCGKCIACLSNRRRDWCNRLQEQKKDSLSSHFLTLTYAVTPVGNNGLWTLNKKDVQDWLKRLRKRLKTAKIKYFLVGEYGSESYRPHYHVIMFGLPLDGVPLLKLLLETWGHGMIDVGTVTKKSINYTLKYCLQGYDERKRVYQFQQMPFALMSKGLGSRYIRTHKQYHQEDINRTYLTKEGGYKTALPRYYREKLYNETQRRIQSERQLLRRYADLRDCTVPTVHEVRLEEDAKRAMEKKARKNFKNNGKL